MSWMKVRVFRISIIDNSWTCSRRIKHKKCQEFRMEVKRIKNKKTADTTNVVKKVSDGTPF